MPTYSTEGTLKTGDDTLISFDEALSSDEMKVERISIIAGDTYTFTGGAKATLISTSVSGDPINITFMGATKDLRSFLYLPGAVGTVIIENDSQEVVTVSIGVLE